MNIVNRVLAIIFKYDMDSTKLKIIDWIITLALIVAWFYYGGVWLILLSILSIILTIYRPYNKMKDFFISSIMKK